MQLFDECIAALAPRKVRILTDDETREWSAWFESTMPLTAWGRIEWERVEVRRQVRIATLAEEINNMGMKADLTSVVVLWDDASLPCLETDLTAVIARFYDVTAVSFNTWLIACDRSFVVEYFHEDDPDEVNLSVLPG